MDANQPAKNPALRPHGNSSGDVSPLQRIVVFVFLAFVGFTVLLSLNQVISKRIASISLETLQQRIKDGKVKSLTIAEPIQGEFSSDYREKLEVDGKPEELRYFRLNRDKTPKALADHVREFCKEQKFYNVVESTDSELFSQFLMWGSLIALSLAGWFFIIRRLSPQRQIGQIGQSRARLVADDEIDVRFSDVAGIEEAKAELEELILFLKERERFERLGAKIPKGVLLVGSPGTGKTLLAKAIAGESQVPFYSLTGSDFVEMLAGVGASRVRHLFEQAKAKAPCIVFIDELDAIGKARGMALSGPDNEREQTLNQLLSEMDGFNSRETVVILAATNRPEILDPALLRPGRFDRQVVVGRPDIKERQAILEVHLKKIKIDESVNSETLAQNTPGMVGADLANLVNESALLAARANADSVQQQHFDDALQRIIAGLEKRQRVISPNEKRRIAVHETGHALIAHTGAHSDPVTRISIISRGAGALGYTMQMPAEDRYLNTEEELHERLEVMLGGRCAERVILGNVSTGASDDLRRALKLARRMVTEFGMSETFGPVAFNDQPAQRFLRNSLESSPRQYSEATAEKIDAEICTLIQGAEARVLERLEAYQPTVLKIVDELLKVETLDQKQFAQLFNDSLEPDEPENHDNSASPDAKSEVDHVELQADVEE